MIVLTVIGYNMDTAILLDDDEWALDGDDDNEI